MCSAPVDRKKHQVKKHKSAYLGLQGGHRREDHGLRTFFLDILTDSPFIKVFKKKITVKILETA